MPVEDVDEFLFIRRRVRDLLKEILRSDSVRNLIWVYYLWFIVGSIDLTFYSYPIPLIVNPMGMTAYDIWAWTPMIAAPLALLGLLLRHGGSPTSEIHGRLLRQDFLGLWMQVGGHAWMTIVLAVFIVTAWMGRAPHQPIPSAYWLMAYLMGVTFLTAQCFDKVGVGMRWWQ